MSSSILDDSRKLQSMDSLDKFLDLEQPQTVDLGQLEQVPDGTIQPKSDKHCCMACEKRWQAQE